MVEFACGSRSMRSVFLPRVASAAAKLIAVVVFPTPPFWFAIVMMAVIFFCLRPLAPTDSKGSAHKHAAIWQLGSYIWVPPPENPQGLAQLYVRRPFVCKEKSAEFVEFQIGRAHV